MRIDDEHPEPLEIIVPRRRQGQPVGVGIDLLVGARHDVESQREIGGAARHRTDDGEVVLERQRRHIGRRLAAPGYQDEARLVGVDAAVVRGHAQRAADIGAELERHVARGERRRRSSRRAARRPSQVPGVVGPPVDVVVALPIGERERNVGLAEDDGAGGLQARNRESILLGPEVLGCRKAPRGGQAGDVIGFLDGHRHAQQRTALALRQRRVGRLGSSPRPVEVPHHDRVDRLVARLDPRNGSLQQFDGRHLACSQKPDQLRGRAVVQIARCSHDLVPLLGMRNGWRDAGRCGGARRCTREKVPSALDVASHATSFARDLAATNTSSPAAPAPWARSAMSPATPRSPAPSPSRRRSRYGCGRGSG